MFGTDTGLINYFIRKMGFNGVPWLTKATVVYATIEIFSFWKFIGTTFLYYYIGLQNVPDTYYEAAKIDGANSTQTFFKITLPLLSPTIFFVVITNIIGVFQIFDEPFLLTGGGPGTATRSISLQIYEVLLNR
jgi:multiple sugar transport system permease protein